MKDMHRIYISCSSEDSKVAEKLAEYLESKGLHCWYAARDCRSDEAAGREEDVYNAIDRAGVFVLVFSIYSNSSQSILSEVSQAFDSDCLIIPFRINNVEVIENLDYYIDMFLWIDATIPPEQMRYEELFGVIQSSDDFLKKTEQRFSRLPQSTHNYTELLHTCGQLNRPVSGRNTLMADQVECDELGRAMKNARAFGVPSIQRRKVRTISFLSSLQNAPDDAQDISASKDNSVMLWFTRHRTSNGVCYDLFIAAEGAIRFPEDCSNLFNGYSNLESITFSSSIDTSGVISMHAMFRGCARLSELNVRRFVTSSVEDMSFMFCECSRLESLDVSGFDTASVRDMREMFCACHLLEELDVSGFDTSVVTDMTAMFMACLSIRSVDAENFDTSQVTSMSAMFCDCQEMVEAIVNNFYTGNVTDMSVMFANCYVLMYLDVSGFDTGNVTRMQEMFYNCSELTELDISGFDMSNVTDRSGMFEGCACCPMS